MEPTKRDAETMLTDAGEIESAVRARTPQEHQLYAAMGLVFVLIGLIVDLGDDDGVGATVAVAVAAVVALVVLGASHVPYLRRYRQVRVRRTPMWLEWALGCWAAVALFSLGMLLDGTVGFSYTLGGVVGAVPFLLWAGRLRRAR